MAKAKRRLSTIPEVAEQQRQGRVESIPKATPLVSNAGQQVTAAKTDQGPTFRGQHPTRQAPREQSDYEKEHYGGDPTSHSDLERMRAGGGLATGRPSPRIPQRTNVASAVLVHHGLADAGDVDPNQGRLLNHRQMGDLTKSDAQMSEETGVPYRRPAGQGWMTGVGRQARRPYDTSAAARAAKDVKAAEGIAGRKMEVMGTAGEKMESGTPTREAMANRARYESDAPTTWYAGGAHEAIQHEALKSGLGGTPGGGNVMRRAVALTSPQKPWDSGHAQDANYQLENVNVAGHLVRFLSGEKSRLGRRYDPNKAAKQFRMPGVGHTEETPNLVQGQSGDVRRSVAKHLDLPPHVAPQLSTDVQKVRNFDPALAAGHPSRWARRQAAQPFTSDTHDIRAAGIKGIYQSFVGAPAGAGGYEFAALTGRRGAMRQSVRALKEGAEPRTSSEYQENTWVGKRGPNQPRIHKTQSRIVTDQQGRAWHIPGGSGKQVLFEQNKQTGAETPSKLALPGRQFKQGEK